MRVNAADGHEQKKANNQERSFHFTAGIISYTHLKLFCLGLYRYNLVPGVNGPLFYVIGLIYLWGITFDWI